MQENQQSFAISKYKKLARIGKGGFGTVYKVEEIATGDIYAGKIIDIDIDNDEDFKKKIIDIYREVNILSRLNHPSILKFIEYSPKFFRNANGAIETSAIIITEYAEKTH